MTGFRTLSTALSLAVAITTAATLAAAPARAADIEITEAWTPHAPSTARVRAVYFTLTNHGVDPRRLIGAEVAGFAMAHLHQSRTEDGVATMGRLDLVETPPGEAVHFAPGGLHVMAMGREAATDAGSPLGLTLIFADGERITVEATPRAMTDALKDAEPRKSGHGHGHEHGHGS